MFRLTNRLQADGKMSFFFGVHTEKTKQEYDSTANSAYYYNTITCLQHADVQEVYSAHCVSLAC